MAATDVRPPVEDPDAVHGGRDLEGVRAWVNDNPLARVLCLTCERIEPGHAVFVMDPPDAWRNPNGSIAGAAYLAATDFAAGMASVSVTGDEDYVSTVDLGLHFLRPAVATPLTIDCRVLRAGTRLVSLHTEVRDADDTLVAAGQGSFSVARGAGLAHPIGPTGPDHDHRRPVHPHGDTMTIVRTLAEAADLVPDGATVGLGGFSTNAAPMAMVRELARRGVRDLTVVTLISGMAVDWLVAAGCVRRVVAAMVGFEGFGLAPNFRRAVEAGDVTYHEFSELLLITRLQAAARHLPFLPTRAGLGTDVLTTHPEATRLEHDPVTGEPYVAATPLPIDVALVHADAADVRGTTRVEPRLVWADGELVAAAATTIVTTEALVPTADFVAAPEATTWPRFLVDAVVEVPWGAWPTSCRPHYTHHGQFYTDYQAAGRDPDAFADFLAERVLEPDTWADVLAANGGVHTLFDIRPTRGR